MPPRAEAATPSHATPAAESPNESQLPAVKNAATTATPATSTILSVVNATASVPLTDTAAQLVSVTTATAISAIACRPLIDGDHGTSGRVTDHAVSAPPVTMLKKIAKPAARLAVAPAFATKKRVHP